MTTKVTKESLAENIGRLESYGDLSINEEYQLKAYRLLLSGLEKEPVVFMGLYQDGLSPVYFSTAKRAKEEGASVIVPLYEDFTNG